MIPAFTGRILVHQNAAIAIKFIESMGFGEFDGESRTIDKLKNDCTLIVRTISGMDYEISVRAQLAPWQLEELHGPGIDEWRQAIFNAWKYLLTEGK